MVCGDPPKLGGESLKLACGKSESPRSPVDPEPSDTIGELNGEQPGVPGVSVTDVGVSVPEPSTEEGLVVGPASSPGELRAGDNPVGSVLLGGRVDLVR